MARFLVVGGTGLIGQAIVQRLLERGDEVAIGTRSPFRLGSLGERVTRLPLDPREWDKAASEAPFAGVVNLAGQSIFGGRWTDETKTAILQSRLATTRMIVEWIEAAPVRPGVLVSASAVGFYGPNERDELTEDSYPLRRDFLATVADAWEKAAEAAEPSGVRVIKARLGVVLSRAGGALPHLLLPYRLRVGGTIGNGRQWVSWVHVEDAARLFEFALDRADIAGPLNVTAPAPLTMRELGRAIAAEFGTHNLLPLPAFAIRAVLGEAGDLILAGQKVMPNKALAAGYTFQYQTIREALQQLLSN